MQPLRSTPQAQSRGLPPLALFFPAGRIFEELVLLRADNGACFSLFVVTRRIRIYERTRGYSVQPTGGHA